MATDVTAIKRRYRSTMNRVRRIERYTKELYDVPYTTRSADELRKIVKKGWHNLTTKELREVNVRLANMNMMSSTYMKGFKRIEPLFKRAVEKRLDIGEVFRAVDALTNALHNVGGIDRYDAAEALAVMNRGADMTKTADRLLEQTMRVLGTGGDVNEFLLRKKRGRGRQ